MNFIQINMVDLIVKTNYFGFYKVIGTSCSVPKINFSGASEKAFVPEISQSLANQNLSLLF